MKIDDLILDCDDLRKPEFPKAGRVHDWRNHVGERTKALWQSFTDEQLAAIAADAQECADAEEWD